jgi:RNA polymerase sigma-70 factor, ECF subfamily
MDEQVNQWLAEYRGGDTEALARIVEEYRRPLFGFILNMLTNKGEANEVFQEVWLRAIRHLPTYREKRFLSWLFRIAHNLMIDRARKAKPMVELAPGPGEKEDPLDRLAVSHGIGPDREAAGRELGNRIANAVAALPPEQKEVFLLRTSGDMPFKDIARIQGASINTALGRMQYALAKLREALKQDYEALSGG